MGRLRQGNKDVLIGHRWKGMEMCGHEMIMSAYVGVVGDDITSIIEPSPGFVSKHSVLVAQVVAKLQDNQVPIRLLNTSLYPVVLYQNTTLGSPPDQPADTREYVQDLCENLKKAHQLA